MPHVRPDSANNQEPLHIFVHVQKCAGSTLRNMFEFNFRPSSRLALYNYETRGEVETLLKDMGAERRSRIKVIYGHMTYWNMHELFDRPAHYYTMLRDPVDRFMSHYVFLRTKRSLDDKRLWRILDEQGTPRSPEAWLDATPCVSNFQTWFMASRLLPENRSFRDFDLAPSEEHLSRSLDILKQFRLVGVPGSSQDLYRIAHLAGVRFFTPSSNRRRRFDEGDDLRAVASSLLDQHGTLDARLWQTANDWQDQPAADQELAESKDGFRNALALSRPSWPIFRMAQGLRRLKYSSAAD